MQARDDVDVVAEVEVRALAADHVDLREAGQLPLPDRVLHELLARVRVGVLLLLRDREGAELALHAADVRLIQVQVLDEEDAVVAAALPPGEIGELAEPEQVVGLHQRDAVFEVESLAGPDFLADRFEGVDRDGHLALSIHDEVRQGFQLVPMHVPVEAQAGLASIVEGDLAGFLEGPGRGDADEGPVERSPGEGAAHGLVALSREQ